MHVNLYTLFLNVFVCRSIILTDILTWTSLQSAENKNGSAKIDRKSKYASRYGQSKYIFRSALVFFYFFSGSHKGLFHKIIVILQRRNTSPAHCKSFASVANGISGLSMFSNSRSLYFISFDIGVVCFWFYVIHRNFSDNCSSLFFTRKMFYCLLTKLKAGNSYFSQNQRARG